MSVTRSHQSKRARTCALALAALVAVTGSACGEPSSEDQHSAAPVDEVRLETGSATNDVSAGSGPASKSRPSGSTGTARPAGPAETSAKSTAGRTNARPSAAASGSQVVSSLQDPSPDREGADDTPGFIEIIGARVVVDRGEVSMTIATDGALPNELTADDQAALFAFDVETPSGSYSVTGQLTRDGWRAELRDEAQQAHEIAYAIKATTVRFTFPQPLLGGETRSLGWTAATSLFRFDGTTTTALGGDSSSRGSMDLS